MTTTFGEGIYPVFGPCEVNAVDPNWQLKVEDPGWRFYMGQHGELGRPVTAGPSETGAPDPGFGTFVCNPGEKIQKLGPAETSYLGEIADHLSATYPEWGRIDLLKDQGDSPLSSWEPNLDNGPDYDLSGDSIAVHFGNGAGWSRSYGPYVTGLIGPIETNSGSRWKKTASLH